MGEPAQPAETRNRVAVRFLVALASLFAFLAIFTSWIDRQLLDTDQWVETSGELLEERVISDAVATYAVDQLYTNVDVAEVLERRLPGDAKKLAQPAASGARELATRAGEQALQSPRVQGRWQDANRVAHEQLIRILKDDSAVVSTSEGRVVLDLRPIVLQLADRVGLKKQANKRIPEGVAELEVADAEQLELARTITRILDGLAWLFSLGTLALFALAAYLAQGRRWIVVFGYGLGLIAAALAVLALRGVAGELVVDELAKTEAARAPAEATWEISTSLLDDIARGVILYGVLLLAAAFLASPANAAIAIRQALAPSFRDRPGVIWGVYAAVVFLTLIQWPPDSTRRLALIVAFYALAAVGLEALSRKCAHEFPDARRGEWWADFRRRALQASSEAGKRIGSAVRELGSEGRRPEDARLDRLERLGELKEKGILTAAEFQVEKQRVLADRAIAEEEPVPH